MKVLLVNDYASLEGGAERSILALRQRLRQAGHDARLFSSDAHSPDLSADADYTCHGSMHRARTLLQTWNPWAVAALRRVLDEFQPDVVHVKMFLTQLSPFILPLLYGYPTLYHAAWLRAVCPLGTKLLPNGRECTFPVGIACRRERCLNVVDWPLRMIQHRLLRRWKQALRLTVANSQATRVFLERGGFHNIVTIYNTVDETPPRPPLREPPVALFAGRLIETKGVQVLLRAFAQIAAQLPAARLIIAGQGAYLPHLRALADDLGIAARVEFAGFLDSAGLERKAAAAWVQVVPTLNAEPFGLVAAEAGMRGTAVIASASGGLAEIIHPGHTGLLVPPGDANALANALLRLLSDRAECERMGQAARQVALREFSHQRFDAEFMQVYQSLREGTPK